MSSFDYRKYLPQLYIVLGFALLALLFCYPVLQGKVLSQHDTMSWQGASRELMTYHDSTGINPLWTNSMFGGMPTYTISIPESNNYIGYFQLFITSILAKPAYFLFLAMLGFYILMSVLRVERWLAIIGSVSFAFATYNLEIIGAGHETKMLAMAYMPAVFAGLIVIYRGKWLLGTALLGISLALMMGTNHYQIVYYTMMLIGFFVVGKFIITLRQKESLKTFFIASAVAIIAAGVGVGPALCSLLPTYEYTKVTMRGGESELTINKNPTEQKKTGGLDKDYAFQWSCGIGETFCILVPYLYGGASNETIAHAPEVEELTGGQYPEFPMYWGPQAPGIGISGPVYFGAVICFLFILGMMVIRSPHKWWIAALCVLCIMMNWGDHFKAFNYFLFDHLPGYNKFRTPTMIMVVPQMLFPVIAVWGLSEIVKGKMASEELWKKIRLATIITAGTCLVLAFGGSMFFDFTNPVADKQLPEQFLAPLKSDRASLAMKSALTSAAFILIAAGLLWAFVKDKINSKFLIGGVGLIIVIDLFMVASNYLGEKDYEEPSDVEASFIPRPVDSEILKDKDPYYRVLDVSRNTYNDAIQAYFHKCIGGYSPAKMEIYQDLIDVQLGGGYSKGRFNSAVLNMLNTKYIIFNGGPNNQAVFQPNAGALGNAWFVEEVKMVKTADEEILALNAAALGDTTFLPNGFEPNRTAVVRNSFEKELQGYVFGKDSVANIQLSKYGLNDLSFVSNNSKAGLAVFSDIWYPYGWEATVDGKATPIIRANYVLRAIKIPAGNHQVEFHFKPKSFSTGNSIALVSSLLLIGLLITALVMAMKGQKPGGDADTGSIAL